MADPTEEQAQWLMLGELCERKRIGDNLLREAGEMWKVGNVCAGRLKAIANELLLSAKQMREDYDEKYHKDDK